MRRNFRHQCLQLFAGCLVLCLSGTAIAEGARPVLFDMDAIRDPATLEVKVVQDWHKVSQPIETRQKMITINVGDFWPGQKYRVAVRFVVPANRKAKGFHLRGGNNPKQMDRDRRLSPTDRELLNGGVGLVDTVIQEPGAMGLRKLGDESERRFLKSLNPHDKIQYWAWPATLMRAITAAYAEVEHFEVGKVAMSGGSKNGATPSMAILHDERMTAVHASVSPIWDSPLRLADRKAWDALHAEVGQFRHAFLGGHYGPIYHFRALKQGRTWEDLRELKEDLKSDVFIAQNIQSLRKRGVDLLFHPGTHDFVCFDIAWGGKHHPTIPLYLRANSGHGHRAPRPKPEQGRRVRSGEQNLPAFLFEHFFDGVEPLLTSPTVKHEREGDILIVTVEFPEGSGEESGRIWWMYDRDPDGSPGYLKRLFDDEDSHEMTLDKKRNAWAFELELDSKAKRIDFFSNHRKTIEYNGRKYSTYISSPYTRVELK